MPSCASYFPLAFGEDFVFSEPLGPDTEIEVTDAAGNAVEVIEKLSAGYTVGFGYNDALAGTANVRLSLVDLSGNAVQRSLAIDSIQLTPLTGDFEGDVSFFRPGDWKVEDLYDRCFAGVLPSAAAPTGGDLGPVTNVNAPPLAGQRSFLLGEPVLSDECSASFRVLRSACSTELSFDARRIGTWDFVSPPELKLCISSLAAGGDGHCTIREVTWQEDPAYADAAQPVSELQTFTFPLPDGVEDMLVTITAQELLWLDSLEQH